MELAQAQSRARFLTTKDEKFLIGMPLIGATVTVFLWALGRFGISWKLDDFTMMLTSIMFFDGVHIAFTFALLASVPELRRWSVQRESLPTRGWAKGRGFWFRVMGIALSLAAVIYLLKISPATSTLTGMATTFLFLDLLGPAHHTVAQMRGISLCFNSSLRRQCEFSDAEKAQALRCEKIERRLFNALLIGEVAYWIPEIFELEKLNIPGLETIHFLGGVLTLSAAVALVMNGLYFPRQENSGKAAFLLRVLLFPLKILSPIGGIAVRGTHGTEYLVIFKRMVDGSKITAQEKKRAFRLATLLAIGFAVLYVFMWSDVLYAMTGFSESKFTADSVLLATFVIRFTHYFMDAIMFKMSDPVTRKAVSPLLTMTPEEEFSDSPGKVARLFPGSATAGDEKRAVAC